MIITLIIIGLLIAGIICLVVESKKSWCFGPGFVLTILSSCALLFATIGIIDAQVNKDVRYQNKLYEREMLEYRIDNMEDNLVGNEMLYKDIVEFNNDLRDVKKWANNPFTNWFYLEDIASLDYIELDSN